MCVDREKRKIFSVRELVFYSINILSLKGMSLWSTHGTGRVLLLLFVTKIRIIGLLCLQLFLACLRNLQSNCLLNDISNEHLFSNILEIYTVNRNFWCQHVLPMLAVSRETGNPLNISLLAEGIFKVSKSIYSTFWDTYFTTVGLILLCIMVDEFLQNFSPLF
jgi:hypothetical protein